jgi:hypothetical protein
MLTAAATVWDFHPLSIHSHRFTIQFRCCAFSNSKVSYHTGRENTICSPFLECYENSKRYYPGLDQPVGAAASTVCRGGILPPISTRCGDRQPVNFKGKGVTGDSKANRGQANRGDVPCGGCLWCTNRGDVPCGW